MRFGLFLVVVFGSGQWCTALWWGGYAILFLRSTIAAGTDGQLCLGLGLALLDLESLRIYKDLQCRVLLVMTLPLLQEELCYSQLLRSDLVTVFPSVPEHPHVSTLQVRRTPSRTGSDHLCSPEATQTVQSTTAPQVPKLGLQPKPRSLVSLRAARSGPQSHGHGTLFGIVTHI